MKSFNKYVESRDRASRKSLNEFGISGSANLNMNPFSSGSSGPKEDEMDDVGGDESDMMGGEESLDANEAIQQIMDICGKVLGGGMGGGADMDDLGGDPMGGAAGGMGGPKPGMIPSKLGG